MNKISTKKARELLKDGLKYCPTCKRELPLVAFSTMRVGNKVASHCRECSNEYARSNYVPNQKQTVYQKYKTTIRNRTLQKKFGIDLNDYTEFELAQDSRCLICGKTKEENGKSLAVDHNHRTGKVRALLCNNCNVCVGFLKDKPEVAYKMAKYLETR